MKRFKLFMLLTIFILIMSFATSVEAANLQATINVNVDKSEVNPGETVTFTLTMSNVANAADNAIAAIGGNITYDTTFFENLAVSGGIQINNSGKFSNAGSFTNNSTLGTFTLKVKSNATGSGKVNFTNLVSSDGESAATSADVTKTVSIKSAEPTRYTVTFNTNGGSSVSSQTIIDGGKVTKPADPTRTGYTFGGWYKDSSFLTAWNFNTDTVTSNITLYAKWTASEQPVVKYTVTFNTNGGSTVSSQSINAGGKVTKPADPTRDGFTFGGWYKDTSFLTAWNFNTDTVTSNITLFAKWIVNEQPKNKYTVTFNTNGGSSVSSQTVEEGSKITKPTDPTRDGYKFGGWYKDSSLKTVWNFSTDTVTENTTLYAKWTIDSSWRGKDDPKDPQDPTVAPTDIPDTGEITIITILIITVIGGGIFGFIKYRGLKDVK